MTCMRSWPNRVTAPLSINELNFEDGRVFNAQHTPIPDIGSAITMQDITYLKRLDQMKSDFVHTVSHDLRSPLTAVLGYAELVERAAVPRASSRARTRRRRLRLRRRRRCIAAGSARRRASRFRELSLPLCIAAAAAGAFVGDNISYGLGSWLGERTVKRLISGEKAHRAFDWAERMLEQRGTYLIIIARFIPGGRMAVTFSAGNDPDVQLATTKRRQLNVRTYPAENVTAILPPGMNRAMMIR